MFRICTEERPWLFPVCGVACFFNVFFGGLTELSTPKGDVSDFWSKFQEPCRLRIWAEGCQGTQTAQMFAFFEATETSRCRGCDPNMCWCRWRDFGKIGSWAQHGKHMKNPFKKTTCMEFSILNTQTQSNSFSGHKNHFTPKHVQKDQSTKWCSWQRP